MNTTLLDDPAELTDDEIDTRLERVPDYYEIIDGVGTEWPEMSIDTVAFANRLTRHMSNFGVPANVGEAFTEVLVRLPLPQERSRRPDLIFVPFSRWPANRPFPRQAAWEILPDLCAEVVSPSDEADELRGKIEEYFAAGVRVVWVVYPAYQLVDVYENGSAVRTLRRADALDGGQVLPGFTLPLAELFPAAQ